MRRMLMTFGFWLLGGSFVLLIWQPDAAKKALFNHAVEDMTASTPYELTVSRVSGNFFTGFSLYDLRLLSRQNHAERMRAGTVRAGVSWWALFHKMIRIRHLTCDELTVFNVSRTPASQLVLRNIDLKLRAGAGRIDIESFKTQVDGGQIHLQGWLRQGLFLSGEGEMVDQDLPVHKLMSFIQPIPAPLRLVHSGTWNVQAASGTITVSMEGHLAQAPVSFRGSWDRTKQYQADLHWAPLSLYKLWEVPALKPAVLFASFHLSGHALLLNGQGHMAVKEARTQQTWADADYQFSEGIGRYTIHLSTGENQAVIRGRLNLPQQVVEGSGTMETDRLGKLSASFKTSRHRQHWESALSVAFMNGSSMDVQGYWTSGAHGRRFVWQRSVLSLAGMAPWTSQQPGWLGWSDRQTELHHVDFVSGQQSLKMNDFLWQKEFVHFDLEAHDIDLAPFAKLLSRDISVSEGVVNATLRVDGAKSHPHVEGFVSGKIHTLAAAGLNVQDVTLDMRRVGEKTDIHMTGKAKKGDIQITGSSIWPKLDYDLHARNLKFETASKTSGEGNVDVHLGGVLESPAFTGAVRIAHGTYNAASTKKEQKQKSTGGGFSLWQPGTIDMTIQWPRDVWYRDGVSAIETTGDLRLQKAEDSSAPVLTGMIRSIRGSYSYFGRTFTIASGEIQFAGTPELNPTLNIEANYASGATTVYLDMTGTANQPALKMHSNPPLSDQDIVSVIVFGQPLSDLRTRTGGATSNQSMMQAAGGVLGSYLSKGLNQTGIPVLNFDMLNIQPADQGGSQLTVGRYVTRKVFVSYGQTVQGSAEKTITADYFLTPKWTLQGASDSVEGNYMDFLFRYPLNKRGSLSNNPPLPNSPFRNTLDQPTLEPSFRTPMQ